MDKTKKKKNFGHGKLRFEKNHLDFQFEKLTLKRFFFCVCVNEIKWEV